ncbi:MAG: hypothetical protein KC442_10825, partial [Thermomicrobiales bacterium]|nr:hypothetical protein [Thermomicrobiales bacterium]
MLLLSIDDYTLPEPALITKDSAHLNFGVDRRAGLYSSVFFGSSAQAASWEAQITLDSQAERDALMAVLTAVGEDQVRLLADLNVDGVAGQQYVTIDAAVGSVRWPGSGWNLTVTFESNDSYWTGRDVESVSKTFDDPLDQVVHLPAPGNVPAQPALRLLPMVQRAAPTAAAGWRYRQRIAVINGSDEPWFRYAVRLPLGDTNALVNASKAQASGADLRVWLHGLEQSRTLVNWNTGESYCWVVIPALPAGEALTYEIVYGNAAASAGDGVELTAPERPAYDLSMSTNYQHCYRSERALANAASGLWPLSSAREGGSADYGAPGAWAPVLTWENPNNSDSYVQPAAQRIRDGGDEWYQALLFASRWRGPGFTDIEAYQGSDPYDGVVLYNPLGIRAVVSEGIRWRNDAALKTIVTTTVGDTSETSEVLVPHDPYTRVVVLGRNSGGEAWHVLTEYGQPQGGGDASRLYLPSGGAAPISPAFAADWDDTGSADRVAMVATKSASAMISKSATSDVAAAVVSGDLTFAATYGSVGSGDANFNNPSQVARDSSGNIYIADRVNNRLKKHNSIGTYVTSITSLTNITGVCVDPSDNIYVAYAGNAMKKYNNSLTLQWTVSADYKAHIATDGTYIFGSTSSVNPIARTLCSTGASSLTWGGLGSGDGQFSDAVGFACDGTYVYIVDQGNKRVQVFTLAGAFVRKWGTDGTGDGQFKWPFGIAVNPITGNLVVTDQYREDIQEFTNTGVFVRKFGSAGSGDGQFTDPTGLTFSPDGQNLHVADTGNDRITILDAEWDFSGNDLLLRQYVYPLDAGVQFSTADTLKGQVRAATETGTNARAQLLIRVVSGDGTVRATLLGVDGAAMDNAFATDLTNREFPRDTPQNLEANYTTVAGDYLV